MCSCLLLHRIPTENPMLEDHPLSAISYSAYWQTSRISGSRILIVVTWNQSLKVIQVYFSSYKVRYLVLWERKLETVKLWAHFPNFITVFFVVTPYILVLVWIFGGFPPSSSGCFSYLLCVCRTSHSIKLTYCQSTPRTPSGLKFRILYQALHLNVHPSGLFSVWQIFLRTAHTLQGKRSNTKLEKR